MPFLTAIGGIWGLLKYGAIIGVAATALYMINDYRTLTSRNAALRTELSQTKNKLDVVEASRAGDRDAIRMLDERLKQKAGDLDQFCKILGDVKANTEPGADDVAGEPIGSTLEALKKLGGKK